MEKEEFKKKKRLLLILSNSWCGRTIRDSPTSQGKSVQQLLPFIILKFSFNLDILWQKDNISTQLLILLQYYFCDAQSKTFPNLCVMCIEFRERHAAIKIMIHNGHRSRILILSLRKSDNKSIRYNTWRKWSNLQTDIGRQAVVTDAAVTIKLGEMVKFSVGQPSGWAQGGRETEQFTCCSAMKLASELPCLLIATVGIYWASAVCQAPGADWWTHPCGPCVPGYSAGGAGRQFLSHKH